MNKPFEKIEEIALQVKGESSSKGKHEKSRDRGYGRGNFRGRDRGGSKVVVHPQVVVNLQVEVKIEAVGNLEAIYSVIIARNMGIKNQNVGVKREMNQSKQISLRIHNRKAICSWLTQKLIQWTVLCGSSTMVVQTI